jgi:hypothetical protein
VETVGSYQLASIAQTSIIKVVKTAFILIQYMFSLIWHFNGVLLHRCMRFMWVKWTVWRRQNLSESKLQLMRVTSTPCPFLLKYSNELLIASALALCSLLAASIVFFLRSNCDWLPGSGSPFSPFLSIQSMCDLRHTVLVQWLKGDLTLLGTSRLSSPLWSKFQISGMD